MNRIILYLMLGFIFSCQHQPNIVQIGVLECANEAFLQDAKFEFSYIDLVRKKYYISIFQNIDSIQKLGRTDLTNIKFEQIILDDLTLDLFTTSITKSRSAPILVEKDAFDSLRLSKFEDNVVIGISNFCQSKNLFFITFSYMFNARAGYIYSYLMKYEDNRCQILERIPGPEI